MANSSSTQQHRCVFVGNIPYDATEEQLIQICEEVGPVVSFRLVIDRETGKPKGYGFCEYKDEETALSARRNLQGYEINGRQLRVDFAENDKGADRNREQGRGGPGMGASIDQQKQFGGPAISGDHQPIGPPLAMTAASVMAGALGGAQSSGLPNGIPHQPTLGNDPLTLHLAKMSRSQLTQIMSDMKVLATQNKDVARQLLLGYPQLPKALFQAQIMLGMVTPQMLLQPNIRQAQAPITQGSVQAGQPSQQQTTTSLPGLPPLAPLTSTSAPMQLPPLQPRMPPSNVPQVGALHQTVVVSHTGSVPVPSARPQPLGGLPAVGRMQGGPSVRPVNPPLLHNPGHMGPKVSGQNQLSLSNASFQPSHVNVPTGTGFQTGSSLYLGASEINRETAVVGQINANTNFLPSSSGRQDVLEQSGRPMKHLKVDDNRQSHFLTNELALAAPSEAQLPNALVVGSAPPDHSVAAEPPPNPDIEGLQSQIPPDLLQQLLSLTPEQLSALTPEQQEQVLQLQKMLR